ncbi:MAG TPA: LysR family transcriptional regulator [Actinomycetes bacterium]|nr:LysR family transcriptional regulator [Actinomycetes bacterium]
MELDLAQVRAFVATAERLHFGRAAAELFLTQQALSKRIQRLEHALGEPLFLRGTRGVELTAAGQRFLPHAQQLVAAADIAAQAVRPAAWPLRLDVWGHVQAPLRMVRRLLDQTPALRVELSMRRNLRAALEAIGRGELDACFGRVGDLDQPWPAGLAHRPVALERCAVALSTSHPLAGAAVLHPADLRGSVLWVPGGSSPPEVLSWYRRVGEDLGVQVDSSGHNLGLEHAINRLCRDPLRFTLCGTDWPIPDHATIRLVPLQPVPCYLWSLVWREAGRHPLLDLLLERATEVGRTEGWLVYEAEHDWLPGIDLAGLRRGSVEGGHH